MDYKIRNINQLLDVKEKLSNQMFACFKNKDYDSGFHYAKLVRQAMNCLIYLESRIKKI